MNILLFSDIHITQDSLQECNKIFDEIISLCQKHNVEKIICLGDSFDNIKPSSIEMDLFAHFVVKCARPIVLIAAESHESITSSESVINHFGVLNDKITVVKSYEDGQHLFCGHFMVKEAKYGINATHNKKEFNHKYVFLGHQHSFELIKPNICQLGSCRYVTFAEWQDKKVVALIENYKEENERVHFLHLKSPIPMQIIELGQKQAKNTSNFALQGSTNNDKKEIGQATLKKNKAVLPQQTLSQAHSFEVVCQTLNELPAETKVKVIIYNFDDYRRFLAVEANYKKKFIKFVRENRFTLQNDLVIAQKETKSLKESFEKFSKEKEVNVEITKIILEAL